MSTSDPVWFAAAVAGTTRVTSTLMRVTLRPLVARELPRLSALHGNDLDATVSLHGLGSFVSSERADEFLTLVLPGQTDEHGAMGQPVARYYTVRRWDAATSRMDIDFVLHGHGPAASWAARASVGDVIALGTPRGHYAPPPTAEWIALVGDATAVPAIARILEEHAAHPEHPPVVVVVDIDTDEAPDLALRPVDRVLWSSPRQSLDLVAEVERLTTRSEPGYVWFSGEASTMREVRRHLRHVLRWPTAHWMTMGYWRRDAEHWRRRYEALGPTIGAQLDAVYATGEDDEVMRDRAEEIFIANGL